MAIALVNWDVDGNFTDPVPSHVVGTPITAGSLVVVLGAGPGSITITIADDRGNTYTPLGSSQYVSVPDYSDRAFYSVLTTTLQIGDDIILTTGSSAGQIMWAAFSGLSSSPLDQTNHGFDTAFPQSQPSSGTITTTQASELLVGFNTAQPRTYTPTSGFTDVTGIGGSNGPGDIWTEFIEYRIVSSTGTYASAPALSGDAYWSSTIASFKASQASQASQLTADHGLGMGFW